MPGAERGILLRAFILLPVVAKSLRLIGFNRTESFLNRLLPPRCSFSQQPEARQLIHAQRIAHLVRAGVRNGISAPNCLDESVALCWLLRRQGVDAELRIGVCKENGKFEAHAWVAFAGVTLNETDVPHERFAAFDVLPPRRTEPQ
ncbi:MAG TPA: lasso peptide biosynthesis B2 protein [Candidatus Dormibacteraeota bacterium]|nr:lasso peptide biosynthesis B2 protein [Candidatus Dormibacteraeota bacterium]